VTTRRRGARANAPGALLLTPGAGSDRTHPTLRAIERAVAPLPVARVDFPYRREGRKAPDRADKLIACVVDEAAKLVAKAGIGADRLALGGRSMGGRICSLAVAQGLPAAALVLISYPLHPPGRPDNLRVDHFPAIRVPCLFISGDRDSFGTPDELTAHTVAIAGPVRHVWIEGGRHELRGADATIANTVRDWLAELS
jgi:predicted alpha/beta-hydrolase family hydrolase